MQINHITQLPYNGANQDELSHLRAIRGYSSNEWLTFVQARKLGLKIKKGEKGSQLLKVIEDEETKSKTVRVFTVFNLDQTEQIKETIKS